MSDSNLRLAAAALATEFRIAALHVRGAWRVRRLANRHPLKLHLGCGEKPKPGWINLDLGASADIKLDLRRPLPFDEHSCEAIYSEHFLEHVEYPHATQRLLSECRRVLRPGGVFSVGVPDTEWPMSEYLGVTSDGYFSIAKERWHPDWCRTRMEHLNFHFRQAGEHKFAYDLETLLATLRTAGFVEVRAREFCATLDSADRRIGTIYVDCTKPS